MMRNTLHVVLHVPKCAGSTMEHHFARHLGPKRFWSPSKRKTRLPLETFRRKYEATPPGPVDDIAVVSGHFIGRSIENLISGRPIARSVVLREPEHFCLSLYNFRMMLYIVAGRHTCSFRLFMNSLQTDPISHFLLDRWLEKPWAAVAALSPARKAELLDEMLESLDHVVDINSVDELIAWHSRELGIAEQATPANTQAEWVKRSGWTPLRLSDLDENDREFLARRLNLDRYIWRKWARKEAVTFEPEAVAPFLPHELSRPVYQVQRRIARRFNLRSNQPRRKPSPAGGHTAGAGTSASPRKRRQ